MIRFFFSRLVATLPTLFALSILTFVLLNLASNRASAVAGGGDPVSSGIGRLSGLHLPLFVNLSIADARTRTLADVERLADPAARDPAIRSLVQRGGATLPHLVPLLPRLPHESRVAAHEALDRLGERIGLGAELALDPDRDAFWKRWHTVHGQDFTAARAARLVRRVIRRDDPLAEEELRRLDTFCLPELLEALPAVEDPLALARLTRLGSRITGREDPEDPRSRVASSELTVLRWQEWWREHYDEYTTFSGARRVIGTLTETRYFRFLTRLATFDFGLSLRDGRPVRDKLAERLPVSLGLSLLALLIAYLVAIPLGMLAAARHGTRLDRALTLSTFLAGSWPAFLVALFALIALGEAQGLGLFPAEGLSSPGAATWSLPARLLDTLRHLTLPVLCLALVPAAQLVRYQRVGMLRVLGQDFMRTARAKGLSRTRALVDHGLRNGLVPVVSLIGAQLPYLVGGSLVIERVFNLPGAGLETFEAARVHDQAWLIAVVTVTAVFSLLGAIAADLLYALVDPRIAPGASRRREGP